MKTKRSKITKSIITTIILIAIILGYSKISYGSENLIISDITSFAKIDENNEVQIVDYRNGEFNVAFFSKKGNGIPHQTEFNLFDTNGNKHSSTVYSEDEIFNTFGVEEENQFYRCHISGFWDNTNDLPYQKFELKTFGKHGELVKEVAGSMHEFNVSLDVEKNQLKLENVCNEEIAINIIPGRHIGIVNDLTDIKLTPQEPYFLQLNLDETNLETNIGTIKDIIEIQYQVSNQILSSEVELAINTVCPKPEQPIEIIAKAGISNLGNGQYKIALKVENLDQHQRFVKLTNYDVTLIDTNGDEHRLQTDNQQIRFAKECPKGKLADEKCLVTIIGNIDNVNANIDSFAVKISYQDNHGKEKTLSISEEISEITIIDQKLKLNSNNTGNYTLTLGNESEQDIIINEAHLESPCLTAMHTVGNINLNADGDLQVEFKIDANNLQDDICDQCIVINYQTIDEQTKTMLIPLQFVKEKNKLAEFWDNHGWKVVITGAVIITATSVTAGAVVTIACIHNRNVNFVRTNFIKSTSGWRTKKGRFIKKETIKAITHLLDWKNLLPSLKNLLPSWENCPN